LDSVTVLNIPINAVCLDDILGKLNDGVVFTPNVDHLVLLQHDEEFYRAYQKAEWRICDSRIIYFCSKLLKKSLPCSVPGSILFPAFCDYHKNDESCRVFLLGGKVGVASKAMERINQRIGREIVVGAISPSFSIDDKESRDIAHRVNSSKATVVMVGLGAPKQEKWISQYKELMPNVRIWLALGAAIDFAAGTKKMAPRWVNKIGLEWLYRFVQEPRRLFSRYFMRDMRFFWYFALQLFGRYTNPFAIKA